MLATTTVEAASILDLARNKLRNIHATTTEKGAQHPPQKTTELVARFFVDEHGKLQPRIKAAQRHRRVAFCRDCAHYLPSPALHRSHGALAAWKGDPVESLATAADRQQFQALHLAACKLLDVEPCAPDLRPLDQRDDVDIKQLAIAYRWAGKAHHSHAAAFKAYLNQRKQG